MTISQVFKHSNENVWQFLADVKWHQDDTIDQVYQKIDKHIFDLKKDSLEREKQLLRYISDLEQEIKVLRQK